MMFTTLIEVSELASNLGSDNVVVVDCRFNLSDTSAGESAYRKQHIAGAVYADLGRDLSGPPFTDKGRHPMLSASAMDQLFGRLGISPGRQVVAYDDMRGAVASRLWWMLQHMGHKNSAVLNGGWQAWQAAGHPTAAGEETNTATTFVGTPKQTQLVTIDDLPAEKLLIDSRATVRYRGEEEPIDPIGGHIPGAVNYPFASNFGEDGRFLSPPELTSRFSELLKDQPVEETTFYCGSGVTACANILALAHTGQGFARLYAGSWSEWCREKPNDIEI